MVGDGKRRVTSGCDAALNAYIADERESRFGFWSSVSVECPVWRAKCRTERAFYLLQCAVYVHGLLPTGVGTEFSPCVRVRPNTKVAMLQSHHRFHTDAQGRDRVHVQYSLELELAKSPTSKV